MPATTPKLVLPYPVAADTADVPRDIKALADRLDIVASGAIVTALPGAPADGQEIYFQSAAMATDGTVWHLRYRSAAAGSYKWEFAGGAPLLLRSDAVSNLAAVNGNWTDPATAGPDFVPALAGDYDIHATAYFAPGPVSAGLGTYGMGIAAPAGIPAFDMQSGTHGANGNPLNPTMRIRAFGLAAGSTYRLRYLATASGLTSLASQARRMFVTPVRVG